MPTTSNKKLTSNYFVTDLGIIGWLFVAVWSGVLALILYLDYQRGRATVQEIALTQAHAHHNKDLAFRQWATSHGRIYLPQSELVMPDEILAHIPDRDIVTPGGQALTLINPAAIVRQLNERYGALYGVAGHITSLSPIRVENSPDPWEREALQQLAGGVDEVMEVTPINGEPFLRLMRPVRTEPGCLLCHNASNMQVNGIAGGVGVAIPLGELMTKERARFLTDFLSISILWIGGLALLAYTFRQLIHNQRKRTEAMDALSRSEARKTAVVESAIDSLITMDHHGAIIEFNPAAEKAFGYSRDQVIGSELAELLIPPSLRELYRQGFRRALSTGTSKVLGRRVETIAMRSDGSEFPVELTVTQVPLDDHPCFTAYVRDMTEARRLEERISFQSTHDELTGLLNRAEFERRVKMLLDDYLFNEEHAIVVLDIDQFKVVNDIGGHDAGDRLLCHIGDLIHSKTRAGDIVARLGGDEFGLLLEQCPLHKAEAVGKELLKAIQQSRFEWEGQRFNVTASIGIVPAHPKNQSLSDVLSAADTACNVAKEQGRNRSHLFHHDDVELGRRQGEMRWVGRIHNAFEEHRFSLYFQHIKPLGEMIDDCGWHYEILLRMQDETGQFVPPPVFLGAAERYSLMPTIDRWVVRSTLAWLARTPEHLAQLSMCSINLSGYSITDDGFLRFLTSQFSDYAVPADRICFEITETAAVSNLAKAAKFIENLKEQGCRFALDDFGSGMSSFAYLKNLPVDFLKIDGAFVRDIMEDEIDFAMVRSINDIGHVMGKKTIAEFVENDDILMRLRGIGVDFAQGYGVARPAPLEEIKRPAFKAAINLAG
ncbi:MAG: EAL domain-containing protein [Gammaproteobacteria bacterium]|nr:EAL domain-containing protein [Gammaproteobacteria bacterium]